MAYSLNSCHDNRAGNKGVKDILMVPVAFTSDHLETLFEINQEYRHLAKNWN
jgi:ferrochelatase